MAVAPGDVHGSLLPTPLLCSRGTDALDAAHEYEDQDNDQNHSEETAGAIAPIAAMWPPRNSTNE